MKFSKSKLALALLDALSIIPSAYAMTYEVRQMVPGLPAHTGCYTKMTHVSTQTYQYDGVHGYDGTPQAVTIPAGTQCIQAQVAGCGVVNGDYEMVLTRVIVMLIIGIQLNSVRSDSVRWLLG